MRDCNMCPGPGFDPTEQTGPVYLGGVLGIDVNGVRQPIDEEGIVELQVDAQAAADSAAAAADSAAEALRWAVQSAENARSSRGYAENSNTIMGVVMQYEADTEVAARDAEESATQAAGSATAAAASAEAAQTAAERDVPAAAAAWLAEHVDPETGYVIDNSLSIQGAAADAKTAGDSLAARLGLKISTAETIPNGTDYNTITTPGNYIAATNSAAQSMINSPTTSAHRLFVMAIISGRYVQLVFSNSSTVPEYRRFYNGSSWGEWLRNAYRDDIPQVDDTLTVQGAAADAKTAGDALTRLDNLLLTEEEVRINAYGTVPYIVGPSGLWVASAYSNQTGFYRKIREYVRAVRVTAGETSAYVSFLQSYSSKTVKNQTAVDFAPTRKKRIEIPAGTTQEFLVEPGMNYVFVTLKSTAGASFAPESIRFIKLRETIPDTSPMARTIQASMPNIAQPCETAAATLPVQNNKVGVTEYYAKGTVLDGVIYSSVWRDGFDVYWNYTLETYYSALANPASILYTQDYTSRGIDNGHAIMGGVCSTLVSYITNMPHAYTSQISPKLVTKQMGSIYEIEVGDILYMPGHVAMISQVYCDDLGAIQSVDLTEQQVPVTRTVNIRIDDLPAYLEDHGYTVKVNDFGKPRYLRYDGFARDIIFERGNNTYVEAADAGEMWFYIPDAPATVYYKKDGGDYAAYTLAGAPTKTVNDVTVYDLAACFSGVGEYELTTDQEAAKTCLIKIINTGTITIQNGVLTLGGYTNCTPKQYQMVPLNVNNGTHTSTAGDPPEGYFCSWGDFAFIESDSQEIDGIPASGRYKLAVDFETGVGLKRVFSDNIGV